MNCDIDHKFKNLNINTNYKYAWISENMASYLTFIYKDCYKEELYMPYSIYLNEQGQLVKTTLVTDFDLHQTNFDDMIYCGKVIKFIKKVV